MNNHEPKNDRMRINHGKAPCRAAVRVALRKAVKEHLSMAVYDKLEDMTYTVSPVSLCNAGLRRDGHGR